MGIRWEVEVQELHVFLEIKPNWIYRLNLGHCMFEMPLLARILFILGS